eukprot:IDg723t1
MNLLAKYCKFGHEDSLKNDSIEALVQGLQIVYEENNHTTVWSPGADGSATGNLLINNRDIILLRGAHRVFLAKYGSLSLKANPLTVSIVCDHAAKF